MVEPIFNRVAALQPATLLNVRIRQRYFDTFCPHDKGSLMKSLT